MMRVYKGLRNRLARFRADESGMSTLEFVLVFPIFLAMFLMTYENGMISTRHVMLEHGVDIAVREVRIGQLRPPITRDVLRERICVHSRIIPDCENQVQIEFERRNLRAWTPFNGPVRCIDRGDASEQTMTFTQGGNNELVIVRVCARFDPVLPVMGDLSLIGTAIRSNSTSAAAGSYALVTTSAFVVEPFLDEDDG